MIKKISLRSLPSYYENITTDKNKFKCLEKYIEIVKNNMAFLLQEREKPFDSQYPVQEALYGLWLSKLQTQEGVLSRYQEEFKSNSEINGLKNKVNKIGLISKGIFVLTLFFFIIVALTAPSFSPYALGGLGVSVIFYLIKKKYSKDLKHSIAELISELEESFANDLEKTKNCLTSVKDNIKSINK